MKINAVEQQVGITKKNIRFYEEQGLLNPRRNSENGYREYGPDEVEVLQRIKLLRKLGFPLEEIRQMQSGSLTIVDGMERHRITLVREQKNLEQSIVLCGQLAQGGQRLEDLDGAAILQQMEAMEAGGTTFQNHQRADWRRSMVAPVVITLASMAVLLALPGYTLWAVVDGGSRMPLLLLLLMTLLPALAGVAVVATLLQRIREIRAGELDQAKQY